VIRVTVLGNRWHIVLVDLGRNSTITFHDFGDLARHLELEAAKQAVGSPRGEP
jgi:hypothetical protein